jgi:hypothetical protein
MIMHIVEPTTIPKFSSSWHWGENDNENGGHCNAIFIINSARDNNSSAHHGFCLCVVSLERLIEVFGFRTCKGCCDINASANFLPTYWHRCHLHIINTLYLLENGWRKICACPLSYPFSYICLKIYTRVPATELKSQDIETYFYTIPMCNLPARQPVTKVSFFSFVWEKWYETMPSVWSIWIQVMVFEAYSVILPKIIVDL